MLGTMENIGRLAQKGGYPLPILTQAANLSRILQGPYTNGAEGFVSQYNSLLKTVPMYVNRDPVTSVPANTASFWNLTQTGGLTDALPYDEKTISLIVSFPLKTKWILTSP